VLLANLFIQWANKFSPGKAAPLPAGVIALLPLGPKYIGQGPLGMVSDVQSAHGRRTLTDFPLRAAQRSNRSDTPRLIWR